MLTEWIKAPADADYARAKAWLLAGDVVAFPTETVYGLGAYVGSEAGLARIFEAKGRPSDNPLIVHVAPGMDLSEIVREFPPEAQALADRFWPGPMTMILRKNPKLSDTVTARLDTVAVRMPSHPMAMALLQKTGLPIAAPSANTSGRPSPTSAAHVYEDMSGRIPMLLDGGPCAVGLESTIIDLSERPFCVLRPGAITLEALREVLGDVYMDPGLTVGADVTPKAPGMKYRHYAPKGELWMATGTPDEQRAKIQKALADACGRGRRGVLTTKEHATDFTAEVVLCLGSRQAPDEMAAHLFDCLRRFDEMGCDVIFAETMDWTGIGTAVMNRLKKAAGGQTLS